MRDAAVDRFERSLSERARCLRGCAIEKTRSRRFAGPFAQTSHMPDDLPDPLKCAGLL
jgi:hypothetical protein